MKKHANIPVFVPHQGCPNDCVFCNQRTISGVSRFDEDGVEGEIERALETVSSCIPEIAFFGGSFTGIERSLMIRLLEKAERFVREGRAASIRLSTRPDYINDEILSILSSYSVKNVELGIQSTDDRVLKLNRRGHTAADSLRAMEKVVLAGFSLTGQMMTGMYGATAESERETAIAIADGGAESARIYPTVVFKNTALAELYLGGEYIPPTLEETLCRGADVLRIFNQRGVSVIRIGLQSSEGLHSSEVLAGEYHDAMGELILQRLRLDELRESLGKKDLSGQDTVTLEVDPLLLSQYIGQKRENVLRLEEEFGIRLRIVGKKN